MAPADDIVWTGTASGTDPVGTVVNDTTSPALDVIHPAVAIIATGPTAPVHPGDPVTYVLTARNVGDVDLSSVDVTIADPALAACARTLGTLATGGSVRWTCTVPAPAADVASASTIVGTDPVGTAVTASAPLTLGVLHPSVTVAITPPTVPVRPGEPVTFTVTVTNTGDVPLTDVRTTSADLPACDRTFPALAPGESRTYSCTLAAAVDDVTVAVVVVGTDPAGTDVRDRAASVVDVVRPGLDVSLTGPAIAVHQGDPITFTVTVTNNGDSPVTGVVVDDPLVPGCSRTVGTLAAGETRTWTCTMPAGADDIVDAVTATGVGADVRTLTDTATAPVDVTHPSLSVVVTVLGGPVRAGDLVTVLVTVTNTGDVPLTGVVLADPLPGCDPHIGDLAPGQQVVLRCIVTAPQDDLHPLATADGTDPLGKPTTAKDSSTLDVVHPAVVVRKTVDSDSVAAGAKVRFTVTVHNTGDVTLHDVVVSDPLAAGCSWTVPVLAPGQHRSRSCSMVADATFVNHAAATARPVLGVGVLGRQVGAADAAKVHVWGVKHGRTPTTGTPGSPSTPSSPADPAALPHTGGDAPRLLGLGLSLLGAGVLALVAGRRPRRRSKHAR